MKKSIRRGAALLSVVSLVMLAACSSTKSASSTTVKAGVTTTSAGATTPTAVGAPITLAVNPWGGSAANANVAKLVLEANFNTKVTLTDIDENASWPGLADGSLDANLEVWPSGHAKDVATYVDGAKTVVNIGLTGPTGKIGWYIPTAMLTAHPELATWEGFKDPKNAKLFASAASGDLGQFLMGDPSYVTYDEQIIKNLGLPLKYVVAGSEATLITEIDKAIADNKPILLQFWQPHWEHAKAKLTEVKLPAVTDACKASAAAADGKFNCDYPPDPLFKVASAKLEAKNKAAFDFLKKFSLTQDQQNEIAGAAGGDATKMADSAKAWVAAHGDVVKGWLS